MSMMLGIFLRICLSVDLADRQSRIQEFYASRIRVYSISNEKVVFHQATKWMPEAANL